VKGIIVTTREHLESLILSSFSHDRFVNSFGRSASPTHDNHHGDGSKIKHSAPIFTANKHNNEYFKCGSAPLEIITEVSRKIQHESTIISIDGQPGPSGERSRKFIVTPAQDPLM
jgi:hypothetical protein